jgi:bifunctional UDP-N-acetylglucosamine pyrophosphorylase/glucosamine-1-phosphate N-acetyltransferase
VPSKSKARSTAAVLLAAGLGKRFRSKLPKALHPVAGRPLLWHALRNALAARPDRIVIVVGAGGDRVREAVGSWGISPEPIFVDQPEPLGTGHAVLVAESAVGRVDDVLVVGGDFDPVVRDDVRRLVSTHRRTGSAASIVSADVDEPGMYARVVRNGPRLVAIVEGTDAPAELLASHEVSALVFAFRREDLYRALPLVGRDNRQREHYLNSVFPILLDKGERVSVLKADTGGLMGPNSRADLARLERLMRERINDAHMAAGVSMRDPATTYVDVEVRIDADAVIEPNTSLEGRTRIRSGATIGPSARIVDSDVGDGSVVSFSVVEQARVARDVEVGPFAHLRRDAVLLDGSVVGNFVEVKDSTIGAGAKAKHLTYVGNARIGRRANIGAGTVTVNYDGYAKHETVVGDGASIGSDTMLVAPVRVGKGAITGAGSVITRDVPPGALAVERSEQRTVEGYRKRKDAEHAPKGSKRAKASKGSKGSNRSKGSGGQGSRHEGER